MRVHLIEGDGVKATVLCNQPVPNPSHWTRDECEVNCPRCLKLLRERVVQKRMDKFLGKSHEPT